VGAALAVVKETNAAHEAKPGHPEAPPAGNRRSMNGSAYRRDN